VVRIDQRIKAYRRLLPPRNVNANGIAPSRPVTILILGSAREYQKYLDDRGWKVPNPAFYVPEHNLVVAYSEQDQLNATIQAAQAANQAALTQAKKDMADLQQALAKDAQDLRNLKFPPAAIKQANMLRQAAAVSKIERNKRLVAACERKNQQLLEEQLDQMYRVLYHELFHAYLETNVYDQKRHHVPRWLNEGLAQVVENGRVEGGQLRVDAPDLDRLKRLYADLSRNDTLTLVGLLAARPEAFGGIHTPKGEADRYYLYSWGLAYYLAFDKRILGTKGLDTFVVRPQPAGGIDAQGQGAR
jgi:hypothetical protein